MTSDANNPFGKLRELFPEKNTPKNADITKRTHQSGKKNASVKGSGKGPQATPTTLDEEADLFLAAVSSTSLQPLHKDMAVPHRQKGKKKRPSQNFQQKNSGVSGLLDPEPTNTSSSGLQLPDEGEDAFLQAMQKSGLFSSTDQQEVASANLTAPLIGPVPSCESVSQKQETSQSAAETFDGNAVSSEKNLAEEEGLFFTAMNGVQPVSAKGRDVRPLRPSIKKMPCGKSPADVMQEILDGRIEFAFTHVNEYMEGHVIGVDPHALDNLRAGIYSPEAHIDLHGMTGEGAYQALTGFVKNAYQRNIRTITVITGRGKNSPDGMGVLRGLVQTWFVKEPFKRVVLAFCTAKPADGGTGALYVLLRKYKKSRGKIHWDIPVSGLDI